MISSQARLHHNSDLPPILTNLQVHCQIICRDLISLRRLRLYHWACSCRLGPLEQAGTNHYAHTSPLWHDWHFEILPLCKDFFYSKPDRCLTRRQSSFQVLQLLLLYNPSPQNHRYLLVYSHLGVCWQRMFNWTQQPGPSQSRHICHHHGHKLHWNPAESLIFIPNPTP